MSSLNPGQPILASACIDQNFITVSPETPLTQAIELISSSSQPDSGVDATTPLRVSCVLVLETEKLVGLMTERDVVRLIAEGRSLEQMNVADVMTRQLIVCEISEVQDVLHLAKLMAEHRIRHLPVVNAQYYPVGIITPSSIQAPVEPAGLLKCRQVYEVMSQQVIYAAPDVTVLELTQQMASQQVSCIVIAKQQESGKISPLGVVTESDIVNFQALKLDLCKLRADQVISKSLFCTHPEESLWLAYQQMQQRQVGRLVVVNSQNELLGILTQTSILQMIDSTQLHEIISILQQQVKTLQIEKMEMLQSINQNLEEQVNNQATQLATQARREQLLSEVALRIRSSLNLETILNTTVQEVRQLLNTDRVIIYQFDSEWNGKVVVESVSQSGFSVLDRVVKDRCFLEAWLEPYQKRKSKVFHDIYTDSLSDCHVKFLEQFQVRSNLIVPIHVNDQLWGLLIAHHCTQPRYWQPQEVFFLESLSVQVAIAIQQAALLAKVQQMNSELEARVTQRTNELDQANARLQQEWVERLQMQTALSESQAQLARILDIAEDAIISVDQSQRIILFNQGAVKIFGYSPQEAIGQPLDLLLPESLKIQHRQHIQNFCKSDTTARKMGDRSPEILARRRDGTEFPAEASISKLNTQNGIVLTVILRDVSERQQAQQKLKDSQEKLQSILENIPSFISVVDRQGRILFVNHLTAGGSFSEVIGSEIYEHLPLENQEIYSQGIEQVFQLNVGVRFETHTQKTPKGVTQYEEVRIAPFSENQQIEGAVIITTDISDRKQTEEALERQYQQALLLRQITDEIRQSLNTQHIFETTALQIGQAFQVSRCLIHSYNAQPSPEIPLVAEYLKDSYPSMRGVEIPVQGNPHMEFVLKNNQASVVYDVDDEPLFEPVIHLYHQLQIKSMLSIRTSYQGKPNGMIGVHQCDRYRVWTVDEIKLLEDIAAQVGIALAQAHWLEKEVDRSEELSRKNIDLERAKREAEKANAAKSEFLANMSHEIRTPMNAILGFADLLQSSVSEPQIKAYVDTIVASGRTLLALINDILDLSKIEAGKLELHYEPTNLRSIVTEIQQIFQQKVLDKRLFLYAEIDPALPLAIQLDEVRIRQILFNVVGNAIKFTQKGSIKIEVRCESFQEQKINLKIRVEDTGIGIAPESQKKIFQAFTQSDGQSTRKYGGTGLGLAITERLVHLLNGTIELYSQPGEGSAFCFYFPDLEITSMSSETASIVPVDDNLNQFKPATILVVDDVASNRDLIAGYFSQTQHKLFFANDGQEAIQLAEIYQPHLILMDLRMPRMDGLEATHYLKKCDQTRQIPIVILTASSQRLDEEELKRLCEGFIRKPISRSQLVAVLKPLLEPLSPELIQAETDQPLHPSLSLSEAAIDHSPVSEVFPEKSIRIPELLTKLNQEAETSWQELHCTMKTRDLEQFTARLQAWAEEHQSQILAEYVNTLTQQLNEFDWDKLPQTVEDFTTVIASIKKQELETL
ncbi:MAG: GAF domain-containing protein [Limnoraphis robusta]